MLGTLGIIAVVGFLVGLAGGYLYDKISEGRQ